MIQPASESSIPAVARLYQEAFPEALSAVFGRTRLPSGPVEDVFMMIYRYEKKGFLIAVEDNRVIGFILSVGDRDKFQLDLFLHSNGIWRIFGRLLSMRYRGLGLQFIPRLLKAAWQYRRAPSLAPITPPVAQILSIVVDPAYQGRGIGKALMEASLAYLHTTRAWTVRLEVDLIKKEPQTLYRQFGFVDIGQMPSPNGLALVMALPLKS